jgi:hypothetical protein
MFGATVTTAGLLPGRAIADAVRRGGDYDVVIIPAESLNDSGLFVDDVALDTLRELFGTTRIEAGYELIETLLRADEAGGQCVTDFQRSLS